MRSLKSIITISARNWWRTGSRVCTERNRIRRDMTSAEVEWGKLEQLERTAKMQKVGAWGASVGRLNTRVESKEQYAADSFDAFFPSGTFARDANANSRGSYSCANHSANPAAQSVLKRSSTLIQRPNRS